MTTWQDSEVRELLAIRGEEEIQKQITGTVKDATIYGNISKILNARGIKCSQQQVVNKLKALKKQYSKVHDHNRKKSGNGRMEWPYYDLGNVVFGNSALSNPIRLSSSSSANSQPSPETSRSCSPSLQSIVDNNSETSEIESSVNEDLSSSILESSDQTDNSETQPLRSNIYNVPPKKKKKTKMEVATQALSSIFLDQMKEMDSAMQQQDDARLQRFLDHEREQQTNFMSQLMTMHERIMRENRESQMTFLNQLLGRVQSPTHPQPPTQHYSAGNFPNYAQGQNFYDPHTMANPSSSDYNVYRQLP